MCVCVCDFHHAADKLVLKTAPGGTINSVRFGVHIRIGGHSQISLFHVMLVESQLHLQPLQDMYCPEVCVCVCVKESVLKHL